MIGSPHKILSREYDDSSVNLRFVPMGKKQNFFSHIYKKSGAKINCLPCVVEELRTAVRNSDLRDHFATPQLFTHAD